MEIYGKQNLQAKDISARDKRKLRRLKKKAEAKDEEDEVKKSDEKTTQADDKRKTAVKIERNTINEDDIEDLIK